MKLCWLYQIQVKLKNQNISFLLKLITSNINHLQSIKKDLSSLGENGKILPSCQELIRDTEEIRGIDAATTAKNFTRVLEALIDNMNNRFNENSTELINH